MIANDTTRPHMKSMPNSRTAIFQNANSLILVAYVSVFANATTYATFSLDTSHGFPDIDIVATLFAIRACLTLAENFFFPARVLDKDHLGSLKIKDKEREM